MNCTGGCFSPNILSHLLAVPENNVACDCFFTGAELLSYCSKVHIRIADVLAILNDVNNEQN